MTTAYHRIHRESFEALASGGGGPDAIRELGQAQYSKSLILLGGVYAAVRDSATAQARLARDGYRLLAAVHRNHPAVGREIVEYPSVRSWALQTVKAAQAHRTHTPAEPARLSAVAAAAAIRAGFPAEIEVIADGGRVVLPSLGAARVDGPSAIVRTGPGRAEIRSGNQRIEVPVEPHRNAPGWQGLRRVQLGQWNVIIDDLDPFRLVTPAEAAFRLSAAELAQWTMALRKAWQLLEQHFPAAAIEVRQLVKVIVPLAAPEYGQRSETSAETFGAIAQSSSPSGSDGAVTLLHERQHMKLSALLDIVMLTLPDDGWRYYAPWRPDPRPISSLLQGAYAHLGVSEFWRQYRLVSSPAERVRAHAEFARWRLATARALETLGSSGRLTQAGKQFTRGMALTLAAWQEDSVPAEAEDLASHQARLHQARWESAHGPAERAR